MQVKIKKLTSLFLTLMLVIGVFTAVPITASAAEADGEVGGSDFLYEPDYYTEDGIEITGYNGSATDLVIPQTIDGYTVVSIGYWAFEDCTGLTSITIPESVISIGDNAFYGCTGLTSVTIPDSVTSIGSSAFYNTTWYNNQPDGLVYAGKVAYEYKGEMPENTEIVLQDGTLGIAESAFRGCTGLTSVTIPDSVTSIGYDAFYDCTGLTSVTIGNGVTSIGGGAFEDCIGLTSVTIGNGVTSIGDSAFEDCTGLTSITIPDSVTSIGDSAFYGCTALTSITIPDSVISIGWGAFLETAWYDNQPDGVVYAGKVAYKYKGKMPENTEIVLQDGTLGIAGSAFRGCTGLTSITIPDSVTSIGDSAFEDCTGLTEINVSENNLVYSSVDGAVLSKDKSELILCPQGKKEYIIPDSVTSIGSDAFYRCTGLTSITIPDSVTSIGYGAFEYCTGLTSITIPDSVTSIDSEVFYGCTALTKITIPDSVISIGFKALDYTAWYDNQPEGVVYAGKVAYGYKGEMPDNTEIVFKDGTTGLADGAFDNYSVFSEAPAPGLTSVKLPDSVTSIPVNAFTGCSKLASVTIPDSVKSIGDSAFYECNDLKSVTIPDSVTSIGYRALGYIRNAEWSPEKLEGFTISGYTGTAAEQYAKDNGFEFINLEPAVVSGDASGDGVVDAKDRMLLSRYLAKWKGYENIDVKAADVNNDGEVNAKDRMILARHLAKWKGYETLPLDK